MAQMTAEVSKLLERALSLSVEEQEALADSLISNLGGKVESSEVAPCPLSGRNFIRKLRPNTMPRSTGI